jgi:hypothetical protein
MFRKFPRDTEELIPIQSLLNVALSLPISEVLEDIVNSLPSIAVQLNKDAPKVVIDDNHVRIKSTATELMNHKALVSVSIIRGKILRAYAVIEWLFSKILYASFSPVNTYPVLFTHWSHARLNF